MKVIFLDIDGVLTTPATQFKYFAKESLDALNKILQETGAKIVISSTWRKYDSHCARIRSMFSKYGFPDNIIISSTPRHADGIRGKEILQWLKENPVDKYVVLDDESFDIKDYTDRLVKTDMHKGLTEKDADAAIRMLR